MNISVTNAKQTSEQGSSAAKAGLVWLVGTQEVHEVCHNAQYVKLRTHMEICVPIANNRLGKIVNKF